MKTSELVKLMQVAGCKFINHGKRHDIWINPVTGEYIIVPRHGSKEVPKGTERDILKKAGI